MSHNASHLATDQLLSELELLGGHVSAYLPDHTYLVVGDDAVAKAAANSDVVAWVGDHLPEYKVAPELKAVASALQRIQAALVGEGRAVWHNVTQRLAEVVKQAGGSEEDVVALGKVRWDESSEELRVPLLATFPPTTPHAAAGDAAADNLDSDKHNGKKGAGTRTGAAEPASGAVADWAEELGRVAGAAISRMGSHKALVTVPVSKLSLAIDWLAAQPAVHWVAHQAPARFHNFDAAAVLQSSNSVGADVMMTDAGAYPLWAAGVTGKGQIVGLGDSGIAYDSCFFADPEIDIDKNWRPLPGYERVPLFQDLNHRKIVQYIAAADQYDGVGHGTHCAGSIAGSPDSPGKGLASMYQGMAPDAKIAFFDIGFGASGSVASPPNLNEYYFPFAYDLGARVHSNSWGSNSLAYDDGAYEVDEFTWRHKDFLPIFAAGNFGDLATQGSGSGTTTVTSPSTCKNCMAVGSTPTSARLMRSGVGQSSQSYQSYYKVADGNFEFEGRSHTYRLVLADFGGDLSPFVGTKFDVKTAEPRLACEPLTNAAELKGTVVLVERGTCTFADKARAAQDAGASVVLIYDNQAGAYFMASAQEGVGNQVRVPVGMMPRRFGMEMVVDLANNEKVAVEFQAAQAPMEVFDNLADFSSQGPTPDGRAKPDILAPGSTFSAAPPNSLQASEEFGPTCKIGFMQGTSMSAPVAAGAAAQARQYFLDGYYPGGQPNEANSFKPSGALLKAAMLGGAKSINGFEVDTGLPVDPAPASTRQGWGRLFVGRSVPVNGSADGWRIQLADGAELSQAGESHEYCFRAPGNQQFRATLVWWDYPGLPSTQEAIVNDLDLKVMPPNADKPILGNGGDVDDAHKPDRINTVEQVVVFWMPEGVVRVQVKASRIFARAGAQPYALMIHGKFEGGLDSEHNPARPQAADVVKCPGR